MEHDLSDEECDKILAATMDELAKKLGMLQPIDLNPDIMQHHSLRRLIVRNAYNIGKKTTNTN